MISYKYTRSEFTKLIRKCPKINSYTYWIVSIQDCLFKYDINESYDENKYFYKRNNFANKYFFTIDDIMVFNSIDEIQGLDIKQYNKLNDEFYLANKDLIFDILPLNHRWYNNNFTKKEALSAYLALTLNYNDLFKNVYYPLHIKLKYNYKKLW